MALAVQSVNSGRVAIIAAISQVMVQIARELAKEYEMPSGFQLIPPTLDVPDLEHIKDNQFDTQIENDQYMLYLSIKFDKKEISVIKWDLRLFAGANRLVAHAVHGETMFHGILPRSLGMEVNASRSFCR